MDIRALARHLDLSIGTVSRALNDRKDVRAATRLRVLEAAATLGYSPNQSGQNLRRGETRTIAFVLTPSRDSADYGDPFFMALFEGIQDGLAAHRFDLVVLLGRRNDDQLAFLRRAVSRGLADGWLISATLRHDPRIDFMIERGIPFATLGRSRSGGIQPWVDLDFEGVAHQAVARLAARGHRRIAVADPASEINLGYVFTDAYRDALSLAGLPFDPELLIRTETDEAGGYEAMSRLLALANPPTAIILNGENTAIGVYRRLREAGLGPGRDIAVIGLRDTPACRALDPPLTCFTLSVRDLGRKLAEIMIEAILQRDALPPTPGSSQQLLWPMQLKPGSSDGDPP